MRFGHFFIDRPRFAAVLSILIILVGTLAFLQLPVTQYPEIAPPTVQVTAFYPGATAETVADTVATPLEQSINGVEGMLYMTSSSTADGAMSLSVAFDLGTNLDTAQILVQNQVTSAEPRLPEDVRRLGINVQKSSPDIMMVIHLLSPDNTFDELYISNFALLRVTDVLRRVDGVGNLTVFGAREYGMRIWLDPERLAARSLTAGDVVAAMRAQNVQVSAGSLGQPPMPLDSAYQLKISTSGRFQTVEEFEQVIVRSGDQGRLTRLGDVARIELGAQDYVRNSYLNGQQAAGIAIFQRPGSNALETAAELRSTIAELSKDFPPGLEYDIAYDPTVFVEESVAAVYSTIFEAVALVILVIILFLQSWRAALIPIAAIPVSLIGTFAVMGASGFSLNNLSLFALVLAIGIVVDDAIVVVENIERNLELGMDPKEASRVTMDEVGAALISIALVLVAVFVPTAFLGGISGQFFRQFGLTIAVATVISAFNSLTLSPALGAIILVSKDAPRSRFGNLWYGVLGPIFRVFDSVFDRATALYAGSIRRLVRLPLLVVVLFLALLAGGAWIFRTVPGGFIPQQDQGYLIVAVSLPAGASLQRTDTLTLEAEALMRQQPGIADVVAIVGFSGATFSAASNAAAMFVMLDPFDERGPDRTSSKLVGVVQGALSQIRGAQFFVIDPPPVRGLGRGGGFTMMVQNRGGQDLKALQDATWKLAIAANQNDKISRAFTTFDASQPQLSLEVDRTKAEQLDVPLASVFETLQIQLGSAYVNDFSRFGRTYRVTAQADAEHRLRNEDLNKLYTRNRSGEMVPLSSILSLRPATGPDRVVRHNLYPAAELQGAAAPGVSSGQAIEVMAQLADEVLPPGFGFEWTEIAYQEEQAGAAGLLIFPLSVLFVFLMLTAQYESWSLPMAVILIVPLCIVFALLGVWIGGMDNNILTQVGFLVLIGLACKNSILIVEFAQQKEDQGMDRFAAAVEAARLRLRPILMTSFAFILGVVPLVIASGAGAEMRQNLGTAVFSGMLGVTFTGLFFTPVFYVIIRRMVTGKGTDPPASEQSEAPTTDDMELEASR